MYYTQGQVAVINSLHKALNLTKNQYHLNDITLKVAYQDFLLQHSILAECTLQDSMKIIDFCEMKNIAPNFYQQNAHFYDNNSPTLTTRLTNGFFQNAIQTLKTKSPPIHALAQFIIKIILINQLNEYRNGTTDATIGLATMDFKDHFTEKDFIELLFHQLIHMLLFIDEHHTEHIAAVNRETLIPTTLKYARGGSHFPAYLAFHSYIVGVEILCFRQAFCGLAFTGNYHGSTQRIFKVNDALQISLFANLSLFTERGQELLLTAKNIYQEKK